jgi:hypothetical protein
MFFWVTVRIDRLIKKDQVYDRLGKLDLVERKRRETEGLLARDPREREREREQRERRTSQIRKPAFATHSNKGCSDGGQILTSRSIE